MTAHFPTYLIVKKTGETLVSGAKLERKILVLSDGTTLTGKQIKKIQKYSKGDVF
ncbi:MAG: hypothetical protein ACE5K0_00960 [Candidatus Methanofastidiosia archaeon]